MSSANDTATLEVNTIALIAGISVVGTVLLIVCLIALIFWCRNVIRRKRKDRSRLYMVHADGASAFSSVNGPPSGGIPSYSGVPPAWGSSYFLPAGYENKAVDVGEFRPNPLAENPYYPHQNHGVSLFNLPSHASDYSNNDPSRFNEVSPNLAFSSQSLNNEAQSLHQSLYEKLVDTIHEHKGRPLYLCKRDDYRGMVSDHFDIIGKTRTGDWLVRPRANIPNRPRKKSFKKHKANKPTGIQGGNFSVYNEQKQASNGFILRSSTGGSRITTPFGAAERFPNRYLSGSNSDRMNGDNYESYSTSLPRDGKLHSSSNANSRIVKRQVSMGAADRELKLQQQRIDERRYAHIIKKNALNGGVNQSSNFPDRQYHTWDPNPNRRPISTIEESPKVSAKGTPKVTVQNTDDVSDGKLRERSGSASTIKSLGAGITDQFKFLEQYDTEEERF